MRTFLSVFAVVIVCISPLHAQSACDAVVGNPVLNCGFESGNLDDWSIVPNLNVTYEVSTAAARTGNYGLRVGPTTGTPVWTALTRLYPDFAAEDEWAYTYEAWIMKVGTGGLAYFGEASAGLQDQANIWVKRTGTLYSSTSLNYLTADIRFGVSSNEVDVYIDDFVITGKTRILPEPSTYALMAAGLAGIGFVARRRRHGCIDAT